jgi:hypothetical protein
VVCPKKSSYHAACCARITKPKNREHKAARRSHG